MKTKESLSSTGFDSQDKWQARDLLRQPDPGVHEAKLSLDGSSHGCMLVRLWPLKSNEHSRGAHSDPPSITYHK